MPEWVRVRDESTRHEFDVEASALPREGLTPIDGYPENKGPGARPRPAKTFVGKDGKPAVPTDTTSEQTTPADQPTDTTKRSAR